MNILNRLKLLEIRVIEKDSDFCACEKESKITILIPTPDGKGETTLDGKPYVEPPKLCQRCGKPNNEPFHTTFTINPNVELNGEA